MEDTVGILIFVGIFALIGFVILFGWLAEKKRREKMAAEAESLGLEYFPNGASPAPAHLGQFNLFNACLLYTSPSPRDQRGSRMPSSA